MSPDAIKDKVYDIIVSKMGVNKDQIKPEAKFADDLGADSLDTVELIMELENEFSIQIPDEDAEKIATVQQAIDYIVNNK
jgi:acyl carrier protein